MTTPTEKQPLAPETQISRAIARLMRDITGRGASNTRASLGPDYVLVVLEEILTPQEQSLLEHGFGAGVATSRAAIQEILETRASAIVEQATGRTVRSFMGANDLEADVCAELFLLEQVDPPRAG